jgi:succinate dehydrogenase/fumarate reductase flavoprotein subunit
MTKKEDRMKQEEKQSLGRREFLGLAAAGVATATAAGLAGCTSDTASAQNPSSGAPSMIPAKWDYEADLVVVGAGTSLTGALKAATLGLSVILIDSLATPGGTTAVSGGSVWIPCNKYADDSKEAAKTYMMKINDGMQPEIMVDTYIQYASEMLEFITSEAGVQWQLADRTDYHDLWEGSTRKVRTLRPLNEEGGMMTGVGYTGPEAERIEELGGTFLFETTVDRLVARLLEDGRQEILGVVAYENSGGKELYIKANKAVMLGAGGFDWNDEMKATYLELPSINSLQVKTCLGQGIKMAQQVGAELSMMALGWGNGCYLDENGGPTGGTLCYNGDTSSMLVNRNGRRFCDEVGDYDSVWYGFGGARETTGDMRYSNYPAWYICDQYNREFKPETIGAGTVGTGQNNTTPKKLFGVESTESVPAWVTQADTLEELAEKIGVPADNLVAQVEKFNRDAAQGFDSEFRRGDSGFDRGGPGRPVECLAPMVTPPYFAAQYVPYLQGTKGGPKINEKGQVIHVNGKAIPRLYACGNNSGCGAPGRYYTGAGCTVGAGMIFSYLAAIDMAENLDNWE